MKVIRNKDVKTSFFIAQDMAINYLSATPGMWGGNY